MTALALDAAAPRPALGPPPRRLLAHIPGDNGWPVIGSTFKVLADPKGYFERRAARDGLVVRSNVLGEDGLQLLGPEANELVLLDPDRVFSSQLGWGRFMDRVFPRGLMMMDFDEHRMHRRTLGVAFKAGPMRSYLGKLDTGIAARVAQWRSQPGPMLFYPAMKQLTLDLAATAFFGTSMGPQMEAITRAFVDMVAATIAPIRRPVPGSQMWRGVRGRARIVAAFSEQIPARRENGGDDLFSHLCRATDETGALLSSAAVVDHMSFLMMAAHDTLTSSLSAFVWKLAMHPNWQQRLREEIGGLSLGADEPMTMEHLERMKLTDMAFKEALRMVPPVPAIPRRALRDFQFKGFKIPAGTSLAINPLFTHHMAEHWPDPEHFDPTRFAGDIATKRHRYAFIPYSGGAHMCLGLHFASMQAKCFTRHLLGAVSVSVEPGYVSRWKMWPIPKPADGLRLTLQPRQ